MQLWEALQVQKGEVVSLVGAGGKTTAMYRLGHELAEQGWRVITTTTTMIRPPTAEQTEELIVTGQASEAIRLAGQALRQKKLITLAAQRLDAEDKLKGIDPSLVAKLVCLADIVIVEADGARGLPLKAPAEHEPVVPTETTLLVPVAGIDAVGRRLTKESVHRPELVAELTGIAHGEVIDAPALARLLTHPRGSLKGVPVHARVVPLINKVHDERTLTIARQIAAQIKGNPWLHSEQAPLLDRVLIGAVTAAAPVLESWRRVAAIVLAAGASRRFGQPKQLLPVAETTMIEHVLNAVAAAPVDEVIVVLGSSAAQIMEHIPANCRTVFNPDWEIGISSSIQAGLNAIHRRIEAVLFVLADQPHLTSTVLERILLAYYGNTKPIVVPTYHGQRGSPVLFDRHLFAELRKLRGDIGGRELIARFPEQVLTVEMPSTEVFLDIDTPADYERFLKKQG